VQRCLVWFGGGVGGGALVGTGIEVRSASAACA
jgi:hypothetical protein